MSNFNVGDKVVFKTWEEMEAEFGVDDCGEIACTFRFIQKMDEEIDRSKVYTIKEIRDKEVYFTESVTSGNEYSYSTDMIKLVGPKQVDKDYCDRVVGFKTHGLDSLLDKKVTVDSTLSLFVMTVGLMQICTEKQINVRLTHFDNSNSVESILHYMEHNTRRSVTRLYFNMTNVVAEYNADQCEGWEITTFENFTCLHRNETYIVVEENDTQLETEDAYCKFVEWFAAHIGLADEYRDMFLGRDYAKIYDCLSKLKEEQEKAKREKEFTEALTLISSLITHQEKDTLERLIAKREDELNDDYKNWMNTLRALKALQRDLWYLQYKNQTKKVDDLIQALNTDKENIPYMRCSENVLHTVIVQDLLFFDSDDWEDMKYEVCEQYDAASHILTAIFERKATLTFTTGVAFSFIDSFGDRNHVTYDGMPEGMLGFPNPHIHFYNCWGDNRPEINGNIEERNYDLAYTQVKAALAGINLTDSAVCEKFFNMLIKCVKQNGDSSYIDAKCITDNETGVVMTVKEAEEFYAQKENEHEED